MIHIGAELGKYDLVAAPVLYMVKEGMQKSIEKYVAAGGTFVTGFMSGIVNESDNVYLGGYLGLLRALAGIWVEEIDALTPERSNEIRFKDGTTEQCGLLCDIIQLEGAEELPLPAIFAEKQDLLTGVALKESEMLKKYDMRVICCLK